MRVVPWVVPYKRTTQGTRLLRARAGNFALHLARGRGSPPLRFASTRGPPSSTNTSQMFMARPGAERGVGSERAAVAGRRASAGMCGSRLRDSEDRQVAEDQKVDLERACGRWIRRKEQAR